MLIFGDVKGFCLATIGAGAFFVRQLRLAHFLFLEEKKMQENSKRFCRTCGKEMSQTSLFCSECGTPVNGNYVPKTTQSIQNQYYPVHNSNNNEPSSSRSIISLILAIANLPIMIVLRLAVQETYTVTGGWRAYESTRVPEDARGLLLLLAISIAGTSIAVIPTKQITVGGVILRFLLTVVTFLVAMALIFFD